MKQIKKINKKRKFNFSYLFRFIIIISMIFAIQKNDWVWISGLGIGLMISFFPSILKKDITHTLPWIYDFLIAFIALIHAIGRMLDLYVIIPNYYLITRFFISIFISFLSLSMIYIFDHYWDGITMDKYAMGFISIIFTMTMGVILEFMKWLHIGGSYYQRTNQALMMNLLTDTLAGIMIAIIGINLMKKGTFNNITDGLGKQIDELLIHNDD